LGPEAVYDLRHSGFYVFWSLPPVPRIFIQPALTTTRRSPPSGDAWLHEVKFDGYRCQLHKAAQEAVIVSKNGYDFTQRFPNIRAALLTLPCRSAVIDGEVVASNRTARRTSGRCMPAGTPRRSCAPGALI
jgi:ATP-dependent DNA ligase